MSGMMDEAQQYIWPLTQAGEPAIHVPTYLADRLRRRVAQVLLDIPVCRQEVAVAFEAPGPLAYGSAAYADFACDLGF
jgi:hypothetical protein